MNDFNDYLQETCFGLKKRLPEMFLLGTQNMFDRKKT